MKVILLSFIYDEHIKTESALLDQHFTTVDWAEALYGKGVEISVVKRFSKNSELINNGIKYTFINDGLKGHLHFFSVPFKVYKFIKRQEADLIHVNGFVFPFQVFILRLFLNKKTAIIIQNHNSHFLKGVREWLNRKLNGLADGYFFTSHQQGLDWFHKDPKPHKSRILSVMEGSHHFAYSERSINRSKTGIQGNPVFLWVGTLDPNKDPLTVLKGFEEFLETHLDAKLYMIYAREDLLPEVTLKIESSKKLMTSVHLIGKVDRSKMEAYYNSSDYFVLGSHYEGSGYSLCESLACGCIPIVTSIPSFNMMTDNGNLGALWETGNANSLVKAMNKVMNKNKNQESKNCIKFFNRELSYQAISSKAVIYYERTIKERLKNQ